MISFENYKLSSDYRFGYWHDKALQSESQLTACWTHSIYRWVRLSQQDVLQNLQLHTLARTVPVYLSLYQFPQSLKLFTVMLNCFASSKQTVNLLSSLWRYVASSVTCFGLFLTWFFSARFASSEVDRPILWLLPIFLKSILIFSWFRIFQIFTCEFFFADFESYPLLCNYLFCSQQRFYLEIGFPAHYSENTPFLPSLAFGRSFNAPNLFRDEALLTNVSTSSGSSVEADSSSLLSERSHCWLESVTSRISDSQLRIRYNIYTATCNGSLWLLVVDTIQTIVLERSRGFAFVPKFHHLLELWNLSFIFSEC